MLLSTPVALSRRVFEPAKIQDGFLHSTGPCFDSLDYNEIKVLRHKDIETNFFLVFMPHTKPSQAMFRCKLNSFQPLLKGFFFSFIQILTAREISKSLETSQLSIYSGKHKQIVMCSRTEILPWREKSTSHSCKQQYG